MAPRKRRSRSSTVSLAPSSAAGSATTSHASSPSSHKHSKSDTDDSPDQVVVPSFVPPKTEIAPALRLKIKPLREHNPSEIPSWSTDLQSSPPAQTIEEIDIRTAQCIETYHETHNMLANTPAAERSCTVVDVALALYEHMIKWAVTQVVVKVKRQAYWAHETKRYSLAFARIQSSDEKGRHEKKRFARVVPDSYGSRLMFERERSVTVVCSNCSSSTSASRYAQHLEKCLGRGGRVSSRAASAKLRASAERAELDDPPPRRRRHSSSASSDRHTDGGDASASFSIGASKRRRMSPVPSVGSAGVNHSTTHGRGLPPTGRGRMSSPR